MGLTVRIVFFGTPELAVPSLAAMHNHFEVAAVVCQPDKPQGRGKKPAPPPVKQWARQQGLLVHQPTKLNDGEFESWLKALSPDLGVVAAYGRFLKEPILAIPRKGYLNLHPSMLPKYRGPSPIRTAVLNGDTRTGVTIMAISMEMDAGDVVLQRESPIHPHDTNVTLTARLAEEGAELLVEAVSQVRDGAAVYTPQNHAEATVTKMFDKADGAVNWTSSASEIVNLVRAAVPWPVAFTQFNGETLRIHRAEAADMTSGAPPGTILEVLKDRLIVAAGEGCVALLDIQAPGKRAMAVGDYLRGNAVSAGMVFESCEP